MPLNCWLNLVVVVRALVPLADQVVQAAQAVHRVPVVLLAVVQPMARVQQVAV
jgi:hypothetical protein